MNKKKDWRIRAIISDITFLFFQRLVLVYSILTVQYLYCAVQSGLLKPQNVNSLPEKTKLSKNETLNTSRAFKSQFQKLFFSRKALRIDGYPDYPDIYANWQDQRNFIIRKAYVEYTV